MSGTATVPLHIRPRHTNLSAVPNSCNAATHSTRLRERDHERGSVSGKERPCIAAMRVRTTVPTIWQDAGGVEGACAATSFHS